MRLNRGVHARYLVQQAKTPTCPAGQRSHVTPIAVTKMFECRPLNPMSACKNAFYFKGARYCAELFRRAAV